MEASELNNCPNLAFGCIRAKLAGWLADSLLSSQRLMANLESSSFF
jgi:hypothetical protein